MNIRSKWSIFVQIKKKDNNSSVWSVVIYK